MPLKAGRPMPLAMPSDDDRAARRPGGWRSCRWNLASISRLARFGLLLERLGDLFEEDGADDAAGPPDHRQIGQVHVEVVAALVLGACWRRRACAMPWA